jgi:hypothetical protein
MGSSSHALFLLFRVRFRPGLSATRTHLTPSMRFALHRDINSKSLLTVSILPLTFRSVLSVPPTLNGLLLFEPCESISPHNHVQDLTSKGFPRHQASTAHHRTLSCPLAVSEVHLLQSYPHSANFLHPNYKALFLIAIRNNTDGVSTNIARSPLRLSAPPGFTPPALTTLTCHLHSCS